MNDHKLERLSSVAAGETPDEGISVDSGEARTLCGDLDIRIDRDANWFYHGTPIGRKELVRLFASVLKRDAAGDYWLETPAEKARIQVDDAPFAAVEMTVEGAGKSQRVVFRTNVDENVMADADHPVRIETDPETGEPSPYVLVRDGLEARLTRAVYYDLVDHGVEATIEGVRKYGIWSAGSFFPIGEADQPC